MTNTDTILAHQDDCALICKRLADGESLLEICRDDHMPTNMTVYNWLQKNDEFFGNYTRAREMQGHTHAAMAIEAATKAKDAALGRLAYDALKWHASTLASGQKPNKFNWLFSVAVLHLDVSDDNAVWIGTFSNIVTERTCINV